MRYACVTTELLFEIVDSVIAIITVINAHTGFKRFFQKYQYFSGKLAKYLIVPSHLRVMVIAIK